MAFTKTGKTVTLSVSDKPVQKPEVKQVDDQNKDKKNDKE